MNQSTKLVHVALGERSYDITIAEDSLKNTGAITRAALSTKTHKLALISNPRVHNQYGKIIKKSLNKRLRNAHAFDGRHRRQYNQRHCEYYEL